MRRLIPSLALALALLAAGTVRNSDAGVSADINVQIGHPAPVVVFDREPDVVLVPGTRVYYVEDQPYDLYRYGAYWYICDGGYWYRARNYRGPFASIGFDIVPRSIVGVPARFHRHPIRPGWGRGYYAHDRGWHGRDRDDRRDWDRRHGDRDRDHDGRGGHDRGR
jgi:hypothetical protein